MSLVHPTPLPVEASAGERAARYAEIAARVESLLGDRELDPVAAMASVACELHQAFGYFDWTGFYRVVGLAGEGDTLVVGPYQGPHGCLRIAFDRGVCGAAARTGASQLVPDVRAFPGHIACASTTRSELVVPIRNAGGAISAVLDLDSNAPAAFTDVDQLALESLCSWIGARYDLATG